MRKKIILGVVILMAALAAAAYLNRRQVISRDNPAGAEKESDSREARYYRVIEE
ncbi:MAG: hypothetical protein WC569_04105 [Candidatus Omnitrophota bacterium]